MESRLNTSGLTSSSKDPTDERTLQNARIAAYSGQLANGDGRVVFKLQGRRLHYPPLFVKPRLHDTTCCQTSCQTGLTTCLITGCIVYTNIQPVVQPALTTGWTNSGCSFNTVVKPCFSNRLYNRIDNRLYLVDGVSDCYRHYLLCSRSLPLHHLVASITSCWG